MYHSSREQAHRQKTQVLRIRPPRYDLVLVGLHRDDLGSWIQKEQVAASVAGQEWLDRSWPWKTRHGLTNAKLSRRRPSDRSIRLYSKNGAPVP